MKENNIVVGGKYKHYKGNVYAVMAVGRNSENPDEELVIYKGLYTDKNFGENQIWIRPKKMFLEKSLLTAKKFRVSYAVLFEGLFLYP